MRALSRRFSLNRKLLSPLRKEAATLLGTPQGSKGQQLVNRSNVSELTSQILAVLFRTLTLSFQLVNSR